MPFLEVMFNTTTDIDPLRCAAGPRCGGILFTARKRSAITGSSAFAHNRRKNRPTIQQNSVEEERK